MWRFLVILCIARSSLALDNGLSMTPPMGWMNWQRYRCETNCDLYPDECVSEKLFMTIADVMAKEGYKDAGYEYVIVDDCWSAMERDDNGRLYGDLKRFPSGMKALGDYIHNLGLKFGLYGDYGTYTCAGYPGSLHHLEVDAHTYAEWGVDYVKLDGCYAELEGIEEGYAKYAQHLNETGRPIVFSCSWPAYQETSGIHADYEALKETCNLWRNYGDIDDSWSSVRAIADWFAKVQDRVAEHSGPGHWNDPDMLIIGDFGLSIEQSKSQMTMWSIMAAPLIMSVDLVNIRPEFKEILLNKEAIAINQDALGIQGLLVKTVNSIKVWMKPILPKVGESFSYAVGFISYRSDGIKYPSRFTFEELGMNHTGGYKIKDVFTGEEWEERSEFNVRTPPSGAVFLKATPL